MSKKRSPIWEFFSKDSNQENVAVCSICKNKLSFKTTTSNLRKHMRHKHPTINIDVITPSKVLHLNEPLLESENEDNVEPPTKIVKIASTQPQPECSTNVASSSGLITLTQLSGQASQKKISEFIRVPKKIPNNQKKVIEDALTAMFTSDFQPFSIVEDAGFIAYTKALNPNYVLPTRKAISQSIIPAKFESCLNETRLKIEQAQSVCITTDSWTSINTESYVAVTAHFIDSSFELQSILLTCESKPVSHTAENLARILSETFKKWNIEQKVEIIVSDHASNICKAVKDCLKMKHLGCYAHALNLIVKDALAVDADVTKMLEKVRKIVAHFKRSVNATEKLLDYQRKNNANGTPKKLTMDVVTRWNSTFIMLSRFILLQEPLKATIALLDQELPMLSQVEWKMACELYQCVKPFYTVTHNISGEKYSTGSLVIPLSTSLMSVCQKLVSKNFSKSVGAVADSLLKGVMQRFGNFENSQTLPLLTFLDPRFKTLCFRNPNVGERTKSRVVSMVMTKIKPDERSSDQDKSLPEKKNSDEFSVFSNLDELLSKKKKRGTSTSRAIVEVDRYLEDNLLERKGNPIEWWKTEGHQFPYLKQLAQKYLCCLATSVPCERVFSKASQIITERRNQLKGNKAAMLMFLNQNENISRSTKMWNTQEKNQPNHEEEKVNEIIANILS